MKNGLDQSPSAKVGQKQTQTQMDQKSLCKFLSILVVDCGSLANPKFGRVVLTGTTFGSTATYSCQKGYELVGSSTRRCEANGRWSGVAPVCKSKISVFSTRYKPDLDFH